MSHHDHPAPSAAAMSPLVLLCLVGAAVAFPQQPLKPQIVSTVRQLQQDEAGQFSYNHQSSDGQVNQETGRLVHADDGVDYVLVKEGFYSYVSPEGIPVAIKWTAGKDGFHAEGDKIPVPVQPVPPTF